MQSTLNPLTSNSGFDQSSVTDLSGRTAVVTGASTGIGFEIAKVLAEAKARVILISRKAERVEAAVEKIKEGTPTADVEYYDVDLGNLCDVRNVADTIRQKEERLDIFVGDAGIGVNKYGLTSDGIERHFSVNNLGHFLLINRLLPLIRKTAQRGEYPAPRIVQLSSSLHLTAPSSVRFESLSEINDDCLGPNQLYARSKLANLLYTRLFAEKVLKDTSSSESSRIYALATHPGAVHTGQQDQLKEGYGQLFGTVMKTVTVPFMRFPDQGSLSTLWAATSDEVEKQNLQGAYITDPGKWGGESKQGQDPQFAESLWNLSHELIREKAGPDALLDWHSTDIETFISL